ncbi:MAG: hypothetical protein OQK73_03225, partial [Gammaproteobacteria bacterium]|nr:hypothetical protein [Gammaproteobacteria bacterium]
MSSEDLKSSRKADHWQRKYYDSLEELEQKEKGWEGLESILRRLVTRLILITNPDDKQLEKRLDRLRNNLRDGRDMERLSPQIDEISQAILQQDKKTKKSVQSDNPAEILGSLLDEITIPKALQRQEKHVRKKIQKSDNNNIDELIKLMAELLGLTMDQVSEQNKKESQAEPEKKSGFLKSLFGDKESEVVEEKLKVKEPTKEKAATQSPTSEETNLDTTETDKQESSQTHTEELPEFEEVDEEAEHREKGGQSSQTQKEDESVEIMEALSVSDITYAGEILIQLLEKMELPNDLCVEAGLIRQRMEPCDEHKILQQGLESTIALVADAHSRAVDEKKEMELFLKQLTERLHEMDVDLQETARIHARSASDTR